MNQSEWQPLAVLVAAMLFIAAASLIQRLMARAAARQAAAERAAARQAQSAPAPPLPPRSAAEPELTRVTAPRYDHTPRASRAPSPRQRPPARGARRRARELLRAPGGLKAAILVGEILGPPGGSSQRHGAP